MTATIANVMPAATASRAALDALPPDVGAMFADLLDTAMQSEDADPDGNSEPLPAAKIGQADADRAIAIPMLPNQTQQLDASGATMAVPAERSASMLQTNLHKSLGAPGPSVPAESLLPRPGKTVTPASDPAEPPLPNQAQQSDVSKPGATADKRPWSGLQTNLYQSFGAPVPAVLAEIPLPRPGKTVTPASERVPAEAPLPKQTRQSDVSKPWATTADEHPSSVLQTNLHKSFGAPVPSALAENLLSRPGQTVTPASERDPAEPPPNQTQQTDVSKPGATTAGNRPSSVLQTNLHKSFGAPAPRVAAENLLPRPGKTNTPAPKRDAAESGSVVTSSKPVNLEALLPSSPNEATRERPAIFAASPRQAALEPPAPNQVQMPSPPSTSTPAQATPERPVPSSTASKPTAPERLALPAVTVGPGQDMHAPAPTAAQLIALLANPVQPARLDRSVDGKSPENDAQQRLKVLADATNAATQHPVPAQTTTARALSLPVEAPNTGPASDHQRRAHQQPSSSAGPAPKSTDATADLTQSATPAPSQTAVQQPTKQAQAEPQAIAATPTAHTAEQGTRQIPVALHVGPQSESAATQPNLPTLAVNIAAKSRNGEKHFDIRLDPPELGRVEVKLSIDDAGKAQANLAVEKPHTLDLLQRDRATLERALRDAGLDLAGGSLNFSLKGQEREQAPAPRSRPLSLSAIARDDSNISISSHHLVAADSRLDIRV